MAEPFAVIYALLTVELALLVISIALLYLSRREHEGRSELLDALFRATRELTRYEYFLAVVDSINMARKRVHGVVTGRRPTTELGREAVAKIVEAVRRAARRGVEVRYIIFKAPSRLSIGYMYRDAGAEVRVHSFPGLSDARYMLVDDDVSVIGLAGRGEDRSSPTRMGYVIKSITLNGILDEHFQRLWSEAEPLEEYARRVVAEYLKANPRADAESVSEYLGIPLEDARELIEAMGRE